MKKIKGTIVLFSVFFMSVLFSGCNYNAIVEEGEAVDAQWANVENRYQERNDLIPNLVATVKGYAKQESEVYTQVAEARSKAGGVVNINASDSASMKEFQKVQSEVSSSLQRLIAVSESYPELKSDQNFRDLQNQLEGIENRIATERKRYNDAVRTYNSHIKKFPINLFASKFGFEAKSYFQADECASKAPTVSFD